MNAFLIFPNQLFEQTLTLDKSYSYFIIESNLYFNQYAFHKQKLLFHRASMCSFADQLRSRELSVEYIEAQDSRSLESTLITSLIDRGVSNISFYDPNDYLLERRIRLASSVKLNIIPSPNFLNLDTGLLGTRRPYFQTAFYIQQRKDRQILLDDDDKPMGGQWSFDADNRKKIPKNTHIPAPYLTAKPSNYVLEAVEYVERHFPKNPGSSEMPFLTSYYPCTHLEAEKALTLFLQERLDSFGAFEDAMVSSEYTLFHSVLSPLINSGLLNPAHVLARVAASKGPLNSLEGFIRQLIGWREFVQLLYRKIGTQQRTTNYWKFTREMPLAFYTANTGIEPIDLTLKKLLKTGYNHHIERLMVLGNFMLLCEIKPDAVHRWFMEMYIDAYDWVMVPNVYGMSQFSDGGLMTTKPYICGSNYILKMSDFKKGLWQQVWDGLFWRFLDKQRSTFARNPRWAMLISTWDKMPLEKKNNHLNNANDFLDQLFTDDFSMRSKTKKSLESPL